MPRVVFVDLLNNFYDQHGIYSLTAVLRQKGVDVHFIGERNFKKALDRIKKIKPDLLLYSAFSATIPVCCEFDKIAKNNLKVKSVIGGPGPTFDHKAIENSSIDAYCVGEGEFALVDFIEGGFRPAKNIFLNGEKAVCGFYPFVELDNLPFPDRDIVYSCDPTLKNTPSKQFLSGRGCPYECTYCFNHKFRNMFKDSGPEIRKKSVTYLLDEIRQVKSRYPLKNIVFNDDTFILDKKWFLKFCERFIKEIGLTYTCNIRANLMNEEVAKALSKSNCVGVNWSIESGNEFLRNVVLKRSMSREQILKTAGLLRKYNIPNRIGNVIGLPGENFNQMLETLELNISARPNLGLANIFVPFPGLELTKYAIEKGYYELKSNSVLPKDFFTKSVMNMSLSENKAIQKLMCLFPIFVNFPGLFLNAYLRKIMFSFPRFLLRGVYEIFYTIKMMNLYAVKTSFFQKYRIAMRYIANL